MKSLRNGKWQGSIYKISPRGRIAPGGFDMLRAKKESGHAQKNQSGNERKRRAEMDEDSEEFCWFAYRHNTGDLYPEPERKRPTVLPGWWWYCGEWVSTDEVV